jgi:hypothetical protein
MSHGLASHIRGGCRVAAIRGVASPDDLAPVITLPGLPQTGSGPVAQRSPRLATAGAALRLDAQARICLGPLCEALGWTAGLPLVLDVDDDGRAVVREGRPGEELDPSQHLSRLDGDRRLVLPTTVRAHLGVLAGEQIAAVVCGDRLVLMAASVAWAAVAGPLAPPPVAQEASLPVRGAGPRRRRAPRVVPITT